MLEDAMGHRWDGPRNRNTGLTEITERNNGMLSTVTSWIGGAPRYARQGLR